MKKIIGACIDRVFQFDFIEEMDLYLKNLERRKVEYKVILRNDEKKILRVRTAYNNSPMLEEKKVGLTHPTIITPEQTKPEEKKIGLTHPTKPEKKRYLKVGSYTPPDENGEGEEIIREWFGQGMVFKDEDAFYNRPDDACYVPELSDTVYTRNSILEECDNQEDLATQVFELLDWQHVSTVLEDWKINGEIAVCETCGRLFECYEVSKCPHCGADYKDE